MGARVARAVAVAGEVFPHDQGVVGWVVGGVAVVAVVIAVVVADHEMLRQEIVKEEPDFVVTVVVRGVSTGVTGCFRFVGGGECFSYAMCVSDNAPSSSPFR